MTHLLSFNMLHTCRANSASLSLSLELTLEAGAPGAMLPRRCRWISGAVGSSRGGGTEDARTCNN